MKAHKRVFYFSKEIVHQNSKRIRIIKPQFPIEMPPLRFFCATLNSAIFMLLTHMLSARDYVHAPTLGYRQALRHEMEKIFCSLHVSCEQCTLPPRSSPQWAPYDTQQHTCHDCSCPNAKFRHGGRQGLTIDNYNQLQDSFVPCFSGIQKESCNGCLS